MSRYITCTYSLLSMCLAATALAGHQRIVVVTGQSNARPEFAIGVVDGILGSGGMPDASLFHRHNSGNWMFRWVDGDPGAHTLGPNFLNDLWHPDGTSALQKEIEAIEAAGDTWEIDGFVWFQGEGDTGSAYHRDRYHARFEHMISTMEAAYDLTRSLRVVVTLIDFNGDVDALFTMGGRTPQDIDAMRAVQQAIVDADPARAAVDSRGWPRFDVWHIGDLDDPRGRYGPLADFGESFSSAYLGAQRGASRADLNRDGVLDLLDIGRFVDGFVAGSAVADLALPIGTLDLSDVNRFVDCFVSP